MSHEHRPTKTIDEKYRLLRAAALRMVNVPNDDKGTLLALLGEIHTARRGASPEDVEDAVVAIELLVALVETHETHEDPGASVERHPV